MIDDGILDWKGGRRAGFSRLGIRCHASKGDIIRCVCRVRLRRSVGVVLVLVNDMETQSYGRFSRHTVGLDVSRSCDMAGLYTD